MCPLFLTNAGALAKRTGRLAGQRDLQEPPTPAGRFEVGAGEIPEGTNLRAAKVPDMPSGGTERKLDEPVRDLPDVYGLQKKPPGRQRQGTAFEQPDEPQHELVELRGAQDGPRRRRPLDYPLGLQGLARLRPVAGDAGDELFGDAARPSGREIQAAVPRAARNQHLLAAQDPVPEGE